MKQDKMVATMNIRAGVCKLNPPPNTETVDFNHVQNFEEKFFPCTTGICETCPKQGLHMSNSILFHHIICGRWIVNVSQILHFPKNGQLFSKTVISSYHGVALEFV